MYKRQEKKNLIATPTGVELIQIIHEELLKSAELTGIWEDVYKRQYDEELVSYVEYRFMVGDTDVPLMAYA